MASNGSVAGDTAEISTPTTPSNLSRQADINSRLTTPSAPSAASKKRKRSHDDDDTSEQNADQVTQNAEDIAHPQTTAQPAQIAAPPVQPPTQATQPATQPPQLATQAPQPTVVDLTSDDERQKKRRKLVPPFKKCEVTFKWYEEDYIQKQDDALVVLSADRKTLEFWQNGEQPYFTINTAAIKNMEQAADKTELILTRQEDKALHLDFAFHFINDEHSRVPAQFLTALSPLGNNGQGTDDLQKQRTDDAAREKFVHDATFIRNQWQTNGMNDWSDTTKNKLKAFCRDVNEKDPSRPLRGTSNMTKPLLQFHIIQWLKANPNVGLPAGATSTARPQHEAKLDGITLGWYWTKAEAEEVVQKAIFKKPIAPKDANDGKKS